MNSSALNPSPPPFSILDGAELRLLNEITLSLNLGISLDNTVDLIYEGLRSFVPCHRVAIALLDDAKENLIITAVRSETRTLLNKGFHGSIRNSSLEPLIQRGTPRILNDLQEYLTRKPESEVTRLIVREGMRSSLTLPLIVQGQPIGVMFFSSREVQAYRPEHEAFLQAIAGQMAMAIERSRLLDALREKGEYIENILQNSADAIMVIDAENRFRTWNDGAQRMFGYTEAEILGQDCALLIPEEERANRPMEKIREEVERNGSIRDFECSRVTRDGRRIVVNLTSTLLKDKQGRNLGRASIVRDITRVKRMQEELVKSQSLAVVGELAATVAHEIKNPLAGISGAIQVLSDAIPHSDPRRQVVGEILEQIRRLDSTVRELLSFSRPTTPVRQEIDLGATLKKAWSLLAPQQGASSVRFELDVPRGVRLEADPHLLEQVWINLFQNAIEAMPEGGDLRVRVTKGEGVRVEVRDSGSGVEAANLPRLFRPFFSTKTRGTGLGLAISRKIIEAHGGGIRISSRPSEGTTIFVELPS